ncbi:zeta toxin family protein [Gordonia sp. ABSL11-1]|uniref:zeta toxin family protein n=1 Tax=Gordonia sp. ABSL11-1 TaxID=3053924 RepID=UPI002573EA49|nr:zeta toxin family protein [Gordonia sp. ABSL11-1]MDL9946490.1 zeta toxin family protein [Gordonia sp. ABSL11-1]
MRRLDLVIGPNGAGKSTFVELTLGPLLPASPFINADLIAKQRWPDDSEAKSYEAARIAATTWDRVIAGDRSFITETVFSHPSKLDLIGRAHAAGFTVILHVLAVPEKLSVLRVAHRVAAGGHSVPEDKIIARHRRLWPLAAEAISRADEATVYDSSSAVAPLPVAEFTHGVLIGGAAWPSWTPVVLRHLG